MRHESLVKCREVIRNLKEHFGYDGSEEFWNNNKVLKVIGETPPIETDKGVQIIFNSLKEDLIGEVNALQTYKMFANGSRMVELDEVINILEGI